MKSPSPFETAASPPPQDEGNSLKRKHPHGEEGGHRPHVSNHEDVRMSFSATC